MEREMFEFVELIAYRIIGIAGILYALRCMVGTLFAIDPSRKFYGLPFALGSLTTGIVAALAVMPILATWDTPAATPWLLYLAVAAGTALCGVRMAYFWTNSRQLKGWTRLMIIGSSGQAVLAVLIVFGQHLPYASVTLPFVGTFVVISAAMPAFAAFIQADRLVPSAVGFVNNRIMAGDPMMTPSLERWLARVVARVFQSMPEWVWVTILTLYPATHFALMLASAALFS
jgi:hypothetical protein